MEDLGYHKGQHSGKEWLASSFSYLPAKHNMEHTCWSLTTKGELPGEMSALCPPVYNLGN